MAGKEKLIRGALGALTDIFKKGSDEPADPSRREFLKSAPGAAVGGAGALAGIGGTAAIVGAKALLGQGKLDNIISRIKSAFDEDWQDISLNTTDSPTEILQKKLGIDDNEFARISDETSFMDHFEYQEEIGQMSSPEIATGIRGIADDFMSSFAYDYYKGRGSNPSELINEFRIPAFKNEVSKQFPDLDPTELNDVAEMLF